MIFDVLTEPWMGVVDKETGEVLKVGLRNYIVNAHMYKCSAESKDFAIVRRLQQRLAEAVIICLQLENSSLRRTNLIW